VNKKEKTPKKRRKLKVSHVLILLFLLGAGAFTLYRLNLKKQLQARIEAIRTAGYPVTCAELDQWYSIPETAENAAYIILDAFEYYQEPEDIKILPVVGQAELPSRTEPLPEKMRELIAQYLSDNQKTLELLHEAATLEHSRYPADLSLGQGTLLPHLSDIRRCAFLLKLEALYSAENNQQNIAVQSIKSIFGVARSMAKEPVTVSQLVRTACQGLAVSALERVINRTNLTDDQLADLSQVVTDAQEQSDSGISRALVGERCYALSIFREPASLGGMEIGSHGQTIGVPVPILQAYKALGLADMDAIEYLDMMDEYIKATQLPPHLRQKSVEAMEPKIVSIPKIRILLRTFAPAFSRIISMDLRNIAGLRTAQAAIAIQCYRLAYGKLPDTLMDLVPNYLESVPIDPFDGKELRYKKLESGYVVYSIGENLSDDGGTEMPSTSIERQRIQNWDITFIVEN
jgi:hypothetical protein